MKKCSSEQFTVYAKRAVESLRYSNDVVDEGNPDHNKWFEMEARLNNNVIGRGKGHSKREAEQKAASEALTLFGQKDGLLSEQPKQ